MREPTSRLASAVARMHEPWGGALCLDFANTIEPRGGPPPFPFPQKYDIRDELASYGELLAWAVHKGTMDMSLAEQLLASADHDAAGASAVLVRAHRLRDAMYRVFWAIAQQRLPEADDLNLIVVEYANAMVHGILVPMEEGVIWQWQESPSRFARPLWPVAQSAIHLLETGDRRRIKVCPGPGRPPVSCAWLFYDTSKNRSRRWCSMTDCGNATKVRRLTQRRRERQGNP